ncbi:hypothetical protein FA15DRAFT_711206 [Coprinopsis marcescibilis]|uniref:Peptidase M43 pregnancy-associated plasma-A domain-containing protein n=1 Tax=Coprinopsis marcescibilis TaxID=230819 RepID=A0A5C3KAK1_COPMA|nr:hypothetical protein FA15DRAFT_711206 [Coprinopsis marcescibilis]
MRFIWLYSDRDAKIQEAVDLLNVGFSLTGISFRLDDIRRYQNAAWFRQIEDESGSELRFEMISMSRTRISGPSTLNVWTLGQSRTIGFAQFPWHYAAAPQTDGVVMQFNVVPGNNDAYRFGKSLIHEVGHWAGLYYTFDGGCDTSGGFVADTPAQVNSTGVFGGCDATDTCPGRPGEDPVGNYMNYSSDVCRDHFTWGQVDRMWAALAT